MKFLKIIKDRKKDKSTINDDNIPGEVIEHHASQAKNQHVATLEEVSLLMPKRDVKPVPTTNELLTKPKLERTQPRKVEEKLDINDSISNENNLSQEKSIIREENHHPKKKKKTDIGKLIEHHAFQPKKVEEKSDINDFISDENSLSHEKSKNQGENHPQPKKKKKKRDEENSANNEIQNQELESFAENTDMAGTQLTSKEKGKKSKNKASTNAENTDGKGSKSNEKHKTKLKKFILFLGNLPYNITETEVEQHFKVIKGSIMRVTLLMNRETGEGRGCGFLEVTTSQAYHAALKMNSSLLQDRKINVEFTAPGKKDSKKRSEYIKMKNRKLLGRNKGKKKGKMRKNAT
ncbi:uncharacterized protein [Panulirus ornatus]|uniref:uncharacterized protein n=1 Tax=Panulirus ornatus TaxID=150431 RepID=UPI003A837649